MAVELNPESIDDLVRKAVNRSLRECGEFDGMTYNVLLQFEQLLAAPLAILFRMFAKDANYMGFTDAVKALVQDLIMADLSEDPEMVKDERVKEIIRGIQCYAASHLYNLHIELYPRSTLLTDKPKNFFDLPLFRVMKELNRQNDEARADSSNQCPECGKPMRIPFTPAVGGHWTRTEHGDENLSGRPMTREELGLCTCDEKPWEELSEDGRMKRAIVVRETYIIEFVGAQTWVVIHPTEPERCYLVNMTERRCSCPDWYSRCFQLGIDCKHILAMVPAWEDMTGRSFIHATGTIQTKSDKGDVEDEKG